MTSKSEYLYYKSFAALKNWFTFNKRVNLKPERIIIDFEKASLNAIRKIFEPKTMEGCYFHAVKSWWGKASKLGIFYINIMKIIIFFFINNY